MPSLTTPFTEEQLRNALLRTQAIREAFWDPEREADWHGNRYSKDMLTCAYEACREIGIPETVAPLLGLSCSEAWNDVQGWANGTYDGPEPTEQVG